ncbi:MAG: CPBP family intramembrane glutamic endopeptidase [Candidatus Acidiferrales bacterium]
MHWDFALILIFFAVAVPLLGLHRIRRLMRMPETTKRNRLTLYASTVAFQWFAFAVILWRVQAHRISLVDLGLSVPRAGLTAFVTILLSVFVLGYQLASLRAIAAHPELVRGTLPQIALKIFPQDSTERVAFFAVVVTVAICEEWIYRGFAQWVFQDWSGGMLLVGIAGSAAMFALAHLYQGRRGVLTTFIVGALFSIIRAWTGSLVAPLVAHFITDIVAGLLVPPRFRTALALNASQSGAPVATPSP